MTTPIMEALKEQTWPLHQQAESARLERDLVKGELPQDVYREYLAQRYLIHMALEGRLREARAADPRIAAVVQDYQFHQERVAGDLRFFGGDPAAAVALPATQKLMRAIEAASPISLLGFQYVFEGSTNGAKFIARALRKAWSLPETEGTTYLDPYGNAQRENWAAFKSAMNDQDFSEGEKAEIVEAGKATFQQMIEVAADIYPASEGAGVN